MASPAPSAFCAWCVWHLHFCRVIPILASISFLPFLLGTFSSLFAGAFLGWNSGSGEADLSDNLEELHLGLITWSIHFGLSPGHGDNGGDVGVGHRDAVVWALVSLGGSGLFFMLLPSSLVTFVLVTFVLTQHRCFQ